MMLGSDAAPAKSWLRATIVACLMSLALAGVALISLGSDSFTIKRIDVPMKVTQCAGDSDCVLVNTAIALAKDPPLMAEAIKHGVEAGRKAYLAGRIPKKAFASASSPTEGVPSSKRREPVS